MNDQLNENEIFIAEPDSCKGCGWEPTKPNNKNQKISISNSWLVMPIPNSAIWLFICPKCNMVTANKNCVENAEKLTNLRKTRSPILKPSEAIKPVPTLILPGKGHIGRN